MTKGNKGLKPQPNFNLVALIKEGLAAAVKWYEVGTLSQSKAAEIAGVSRYQFLEALDRYNVSPFQVTSEELVQELARD